MIKNKKKKNIISKKIFFGTWRIGGDIVPNLNNDDQKDIEIIQFAILNGLTHIDTSESYAGGKTERIIGKAIKIFNRDRYFISTKVREYNLKYDDLILSCKKSLQRLGISYINLYYVHKQNPNISIKETADALNFLLRSGKIKQVGLSNVSIETIEKFNEFLDKPVFAVQNQYNVVCRESQKKKVIKYCIKNNIIFVAWRPLLLTFPGSKNQYKKGTYPILDKLAAKYRVTNTQIIAKWLIQQNISIVFKSTNKKHIKEIIDVINFDLSKSDFDKIQKEFPVIKYTGCTAQEYFTLT